MMTWPAELPQRVNREGYQASWSDGMQWADTDTGPGKSRLGTWAAIEPMTCAVDVSIAQLSRFDRFYREDLRRGSDYFLMRRPEYDGVPLLTPAGAVLTTPAGVPLLVSSWCIVRFAKDQRPARQYLGGPWWRLTMALEVMP